MYCEEENNQNNKLDLVKNNILTKLVLIMKTQTEGIKDILCDYAINCKGSESLVNENFWVNYVILLPLVIMKKY